MVHTYRAVWIDSLLLPVVCQSLPSLWFLFQCHYSVPSQGHAWSLTHPFCTHRVATHILAFEGDSKVTWFEGGWSEYEADLRSRLGGSAVSPHRLKFRKLATV